MSEKCACYVKYEGQDHWGKPIEDGIEFCPLHAAAPAMKQILDDIHYSFTNIWALDRKKYEEQFLPRIEQALKSAGGEKYDGRKKRSSSHFC